jgi:hypothetical protein
VVPPPGVTASPTKAPTNPPPAPPPGSAVTDQDRTTFLTANAANLNNGNIVTLTDPRILPNKRTRTADEGCAIQVNGFICADLARNIRCVNGKVGVNVVNPFNQNNLLKACVGGFCGGTAGDNPQAGQNPCVATAAQAVAANKAGNEFFLPPPTPAGRLLKETESIRELQSFYDGTETANDLNWEEGFSGAAVVDGLVPVDDTNTASIAGGVVGALGVVGAAAFVVIKRRKSSLSSTNNQMVARNPIYDAEIGGDFPPAQQSTFNPDVHANNYPNQHNPHFQTTYNNNYQVT